MLGPAGYMVVAHVILVSAQVLLVLTLGLWDLGHGLTILVKLDIFLNYFKSYQFVG